MVLPLLGYCDGFMVPDDSLSSWLMESWTFFLFFGSVLLLSDGKRLAGIGRGSGTGASGKIVHDLVNCATAKKIYLEFLLYCKFSEENCLYKRGVYIA